MADMVAAAARALLAEGRYAVVTGRHWDGVGALVDSAEVHVLAPGPSTRLAVATGVGLGGHRAVAVVEHVPAGAPPDADTLAFTTSPAAAVQALHAGWTVVQPWSGDDVAPLIDAAPQPALVVLAGDAGTTDVDPPLPRRTRLWVDGDLATLVGSGASVPTMIALAQRLQQRGVDIAAVEVAILSSPAQEPLVGGTSILVGGRDTAGAFRGEHWPDLEVSAVSITGQQEADLIGAVLAVIPAMP